MSMQMQVFNIYCDETRVENPDSARMVIGAVIIPRLAKNTLVEAIGQIKMKHGFYQPIKWNKVGTRYLGFYRELIDFFLSRPEIMFRCIIVDKSRVRYDVFHDDDHELAFFKFYYLMLRERLSDMNEYHIYLDRKPTRDKNRARSLKAFLDSYILLHRHNCNIRHLQSYPSRPNAMIQLADFLIGIVGHASNPASHSAKSEVATYLREQLHRRTLCQTSPLKETKCNVFVWEGDR